MTEAEDKKIQKISSILGHVISVTVNEATVLARLEKYFSPTPAKLAQNEEEGNLLQKQIDNLIEKLGGPPRLIIKGNDEKKSTYDNYPIAAISEIINVFHRVRRSVTRAQLYLTGSDLINKNPEILDLSATDDVTKNLQEIVFEVFWEHVETSLIRLVSYWDRVGQLFDFVFFGIRQFDRDGFTAVMDKIHNNIVPVHNEIKTSRSWIALRKFQTSENEDGLKWLLRRRNLIVHSVYLRPLGNSSEENTLFESSYNHLDIKLRNKLKPGEPIEEIKKLNIHLSAAASLLKNVISLCEEYISLVE